MSLNEDLQTWTAAQKAAWRIQHTWERFWTVEATREALIGHCTWSMARRRYYRQVLGSSGPHVRTSRS